MVSSCCSAACQTQHTNGTGQHFYDCNPLSTFTATTATEACKAFTDDATGSKCSAFTCTGGGSNKVVCSNSASICVCWNYSGTFVGHYYNSGSTSCLCPGSLDPTWN
jgi:hypothetical protein